MSFPDLTLAELQGYAADVTLATGANASWPCSSSGDVEMPFLVPKETMNTIPQHIKNHLPIKGQQLIVNRNLDLLDLFAGVARITNWAIKGGLNAIAMDKTYGDHMNMSVLHTDTSIYWNIQYKPECKVSPARKQPWRNVRYHQLQFSKEVIEGDVMT